MEKGEIVIQDVLTSDIVRYIITLYKIERVGYNK